MAAAEEILGGIARHSCLLKMLSHEEHGTLGGGGLLPLSISRGSDMGCGLVVRSLGHGICGKFLDKKNPKILLCRVGYEIKVYLFACWKLYSILLAFIPGPKNLFANKLFLLFAATMAWSGFGPYHGMWREYAQTKCIGAIPTPWAMTIVLGLGVITPQPKLYNAYSRAILCNFYFMS